MKTLQELKNKKFKVERVVTPPAPEVLLNKFLKRLQPEEFRNQYERKNNFSIKKLSDNSFEITADVFYQYTLPMDEEIRKENINFEYANYEKEHFEKINRDLHKFYDFKHTINIEPAEEEKTTGEVFIKSSGLYYFGDWRGEELRTTNLIKNNNGEIIGFFINDYRENRIEYRFV